MNVYDFDNTILRGDSTVRFCLYCLRRYPRIWPDIPAQLVNGALFLLKKRDLRAFKQRLLRFVRKIDVDRALKAFWRRNYCRIKPFYPQIQRPDDVIISASPEFIIAPACFQLGIRHYMGSPVEPTTGEFLGPNCQGEEKIRRFRQAYPDAEIDTFYSDSHSDDPLARIARRAVMVKGDQLLPWQDAR